MADHPLRPAIRRRLGEPLPHQQADGTRTDLSTPEGFLLIHQGFKEQNLLHLVPSGLGLSNNPNADWIRPLGADGYRWDE